jgi:hypothetical protein
VISSLKRLRLSSLHLVGVWVSQNPLLGFKGRVCPSMELLGSPRHDPWLCDSPADSRSLTVTTLASTTTDIRGPISIIPTCRMWP